MYLNNGNWFHENVLHCRNSMIDYYYKIVFTIKLKSIKLYRTVLFTQWLLCSLTN
uniref:Uncharacterized protein n=1 Tax=Anguilla anguilla TaxID=7936 RepID=A0A0E9TDF0_ANGAN